MKLQIGSLAIFASKKGEWLFVLPVKDCMVAVNIELFANVGGSDSINIDTDIYEKGDLLVEGKIQRRINEIEKESAIS